MKTTIHGVETHYQKIGKGKPVIFLHGWGCDWQIWSSIIQPLSEHNELILVDLPTFGSSGEPREDWDLFDFVDWLGDFVNQIVGEKKFVLVGHSFGGQIASVYASKTPKNIEKLILIGSAGLADELSTSRKMQEKVLSFIPSFAKQIFSNNIRRKILTAIGSPTDHLNATFYQRKVLKKVTRTYIQDYLEKIKVPTILIWGKNDDATPLHHAEEFHRRITNSELIIFEHAGHYVFLDQRSKFIQIMKKELQSKK